MRVLIVEDEPITRKVLSYFLTHDGWEVIGARGYLETLELAAVKPPDVLVCDWNLPVGDGGQVARVLRQSHPQVPVIFISGHPVELLAEKAADIPNATFLQKPFDAEMMGDLIREVAARAACTQPAALD